MFVLLISYCELLQVMKPKKWSKSSVIQHERSLTYPSGAAESRNVRTEDKSLVLGRKHLNKQNLCKGNKTNLLTQTDKSNNKRKQFLFFLMITE